MKDREPEGFFHGAPQPNSSLPCTEGTNEKLGSALRAALSGWVFRVRASGPLPSRLDPWWVCTQDFQVQPLC